MGTVHSLRFAGNRSLGFSVNGISTIRLILLLALMFATLWLVDLNSSRPDSSPMILPAPAVRTVSRTPPGEDNYVRIPYFTELGGMTSILTLNNNMPETSIADVTIFNSKGEPFVAPPIGLRSQTAARFSLRELTRDARGDFNSGSVQVFYHGPSMAVTCQLSVTSESKRISFESVEASAMEFESSTLDGIVWSPDDGTRPSVALTNTTPNDLSVTMTAGQAQDRKARTITLDGQQMRIIDLREFVESKRGASALIKVEHSGAPGALVATGFALNQQTGFSCSLPFIDRSTAKTTHLAGAHVRLGRADAKEGFPSGTSFLAPLVVANAGDSPTEARIFVDYTADSGNQN